MIGSVNLSKSGFDADSIEVLYGVLVESVVTLDYPEGFNFYNCVPISIGVETESPIDYMYNDTSKYISVQMFNGGINLFRQLPAGETIYYRVVLLKLPEPDISGYQLGDVNMNGKVNKSDINYIIHYINQNENTQFNSKQFKLADMNKNGMINANDSLAIAKDTED